MTDFRFETRPLTEPRMGLVVLSADETTERDFNRLLPRGVTVNTSRVPSGLDVTTDTLAAMEAHLPAAAALLPRGDPFDAVAYACTSGTSVIGVARVAELMRLGVEAQAVTNPVSALIAACRHLGLERLAILSPYVPEVSDRLRSVLAAEGVATPVFGSFNESDEATVVRITPASIIDAAAELVTRGKVDGLFLSCTNLRTLDVIAPIEAATGLPVLSSNTVLAWHLCHLAGAACPTEPDCSLFRSPLPQVTSRGQ